MLKAVIAAFIVTVAFAHYAADGAGKGKRVALIISNSKYEHASALANPPLDAKALYKTFVDMSFDDVETLVDATADTMRKRLRDFALKARLSDVAVIYYAGHGLEADGQNYLVPTDARLETEFDIAYETVGIDLAVRAVNGAKKLKLLILDACRNNPFTTAGKDGKPRSFGTGLAPVETAGDVLVSYAAAAGQVALDGKAGDNSPFAKALVQHLGAPGVDVRQVLGRVRDDVASATREKQKPFIYASIGGDPVFLVPPPDEAPRNVSPVVVDFTLADPADDNVKEALGPETDQFAFGYDMTRAAGQGAKLTPKLDYFVSAQERGRPLIEAEQYGYFSAEESPPWQIGYPLLDIIARRDQPRVITLSNIVVEVEQSAPDDAAYVGLISPSTDFGKLVLFNEGWSDVKKATLEYDVVGLDPPSRQQIEELTKAKRDGGYTHKAEVGAFVDYAYVSVAAGLNAAMPDFAFYEYAFRSQFPGDKPKKIAKPKDYAEWLKKKPEVLVANADPNRKGMWIAGRLIVESSKPGAAPVIADFFAPVPLYAPDGLGGGAISYNLKERINLRAEGVRYSVQKNIGYLLDQDTKTFRGLYPLTVDRTSRHKIRVVLKGDGGKQLYASDWMEALIVVPRLSKKSVDWVAAGSPGKAPFQGID